MKPILRMAIKDLRLLSRDRIGMFFMVVFPIVMGVFFGFVMGSMGDRETTRVSLAVIDEDDSAMSRRFAEALAENSALKVTHPDRNAAQDAVRRGRLVGMLVIPPGFGETAGIIWAEQPEIELGVDPSRAAESAMLEGMLMQAMGELIGARFRDPLSMRASLTDAKEQIVSSDAIRPEMKLMLGAFMGSVDTLLGSLGEIQAQPDIGDATGFGPEIQIASIRRIDVTREVDPNSPEALLNKLRSRWDISFPQAMVWGVLGCVAGFATLMVRENTLGTMARLQVAPIPRWQILAGKGVGCFIAVICVITMMMVVGTVLGMRPRSWPLLGLVTVCTAYCFVGIMMLLSLMGKTEQAAGGAAWGACTFMAMFGGGMIPVAFMPGFMATMSNYDPVKWAVVGVEGAVWRGFTLTEMLLPCGILIGFGTVSLGLGAWLIGRRTAS